MYCYMCIQGKQTQMKIEWMDIMILCLFSFSYNTDAHNRGKSGKLRRTFPDRENIGNSPNSGKTQKILFPMFAIQGKYRDSENFTKRVIVFIHIFSYWKLYDKDVY